MQIIQNMHFKNQLSKILLAALCMIMPHLSWPDQDQWDQGRTDFQTPDYIFFKDPFLYKQKASVQLVGEDPILAPDAKMPIVDLEEADDADYAYFNDPYAFLHYRTNLPIQARFSGYVQYSAWWDSRQNVTFGDGYILLWPRKREFDPDCRDINAQGQNNMSSVETRFRLELLGPEVFGATTSGYGECDVFGIDFTSITGIGIDRWRMRHAFVQLKWQKATLLLGQFWHPFCVPKNFPLLIGYGGGAPAQGYAFIPQIRITATDNKGTEITFIASEQISSESNGPIGLSSSYQRNARLPELSFLASHEAEHHYTGFGFTMLRLKPRLQSNRNFRVNESINSMGFCLFNKLIFEPLEIRSDLIYIQNGTHLGMLGGYAVSTLNPFTDERRYTNLNSINFWLDININQPLEPGLFIGISKNLGARRPIIQTIFNPLTGTVEETIYALNALDEANANGDQIDTVLRIAPRIRYHALPAEFGMEVEYIRATYGCINNRGGVDNIDPAANTRLILSSYYYF